MNARVDTLERFDLGGPPQWALVRGRADRPVLLLVQAGPGLPMIHEARATERRLRLEEHFRVVYWDQRGTGKSFDARDRETWTLETLVGDVRSMVGALCDRLGVAAIDVVGFSFGASLALLAAAGDALPVRSLVCVGPDVDLLENERAALSFALAEAGRRAHRRALRALQAIGAPPHDDPDRFMTRVKWVSSFGGVHRRMGFGGMLRTTLARLWTSPHYTLREKVAALSRIGATQARMIPALQGLDLLARPLHVGMPVAVFQGRHDAVCPPPLAEALAGRLRADLVWFDDSAHMPHEEQPEKFREELLRFMSLHDRASAASAC